MKSYYWIAIMALIGSLAGLLLNQLFTSNARHLKMTADCRNLA